MTRKALGRGLEALLPQPVAFTKDPATLDVSEITPNPYQPRTSFSDEELQGLADSILENGLLQPIIVRRAPTGYELIAGERRWRACQKAGLMQIPAVVREVTDQKMLELALVENIQRDDLNALEEAHAYKLLIDEFKLTQESLAIRVGKSRTAITNALRLLKLSKSVQALLVNGEISMGHARALLPLNPTEQLKLARTIASKGLSVRQVERRVRKLLESAPDTDQPQQTIDPNLQAAQDRLEATLQTKVEIKPSGLGGRIVVYFHSDEELERLFQDLTSVD